MKRRFFVIFFAALLTVSLAVAGYAQMSAYHAPQTAAEKALARLMEMEVGNRNFLSAAFSDFLPGYSAARAQQYASLFTASFISNYRAESLRAYRKCVGSQSRLCFDPPILSCSMNVPANKPFRTISNDGHVAQIAYSWRGNADRGQYRMVNENGYWKLDAFSCMSSD